MFIQYQGKKYPDPRPLKVRELTLIESQFGSSLHQLGEFSQTTAFIWVGIERLDPGKLAWDDLMDMTEDEFADLVRESPPVSKPYVEPAEEELPADPTIAEDLTGVSSGYPTPLDLRSSKID